MKLCMPPVAIFLLAAAPETLAVPWTYVSPNGARAFAIADAGDRLLLGTVQGMHQSFDGGVTWSHVVGFGSRGRPYLITTNPHVAGHWHAFVHQTQITHDSYGNPIPYVIPTQLETRDAGATWQRPSIDNPNVGSLPIFHPVVNHALTWYSYEKWFHSANGGMTWSTYYLDSARVYSAVGLPLPGNPFGAIFHIEGVELPFFHISTGGGSGWSAVAPRPSTLPRYASLRLHPRRIPSHQLLWTGNSYDLSPSVAGTIDFTSGAVVSFPTTNGEFINILDDPAQNGAVVGLVDASDHPVCQNRSFNRIVGLAPGATQWHSRSMDYSGAISDGPTNPQLLAGAGSRLWIAHPMVGAQISDDGGYTWLTSNTGIDEAPIGAILIDRRNPQILLAGRQKQSLQRSVDGGTSWTDVGGDVPHDVRSLTRSSSDADHLAAAAEGGIYRSRDNGATWQRIPTTLEPSVCLGGWHKIAWCANDDRQLIASGGQSLYRSADAGATWTLVVGPTFTNYGPRLETARSSPGRTYFTDTTGAWRVSTDCGVTSSVLAGVEAVTTVDPNNSARIVGSVTGMTGLASSADGGQTWTETEVQGGTEDYPRESWIDACLSSRLTTSNLWTTSLEASGLPVPEPPAATSWFSSVLAVDSQCVGLTSYNVVATTGGGLWVSVANLERIFADGLEAAD